MGLSARSVGLYMTPHEFEPLKERDVDDRRRHETNWCRKCLS